MTSKEYFSDFSNLDRTPKACTRDDQFTIFQEFTDRKSRHAAGVPRPYPLWCCLGQERVPADSSSSVSVTSGHPLGNRWLIRRPPRKSPLEVRGRPAACRTVRRQKAKVRLEPTKGSAVSFDPTHRPPRKTPASSRRCAKSGRNPRRSAIRKASFCHRMSIAGRPGAPCAASNIDFGPS
jgi:hypothetical protein